MRREGNRNRKADRGSRTVLLLATLLSRGAEAGLRLAPDSGPHGGDVRCARGLGRVFFLGGDRERGSFAAPPLLKGLGAGRAFRQAGLLGRHPEWRGLGGDGRRALAPVGAQGRGRSRRAPLSTVAFPTTVAVDAAGLLWVGGLGVWRRTGETWTAAPSRGVGIVTSMLADPSGLVVGLSTGVAARWTGASWTSLSGGVGPAEGFRALAAFGGTLWAGTNVTLYAWNGSSWVADAAFGGHDVRALTSWSGSLRVATADAGVLVRSGSAWLADRKRCPSTWRAGIPRLRRRTPSRDGRRKAFLLAPGLRLDAARRGRARRPS